MVIYVVILWIGLLSLYHNAVYTNVLRWYVHAGIHMTYVILRLVPH